MASQEGEGESLSEMLGTRVSISVLNKIDELCRLSGRTRADVVRFLIEENLANVKVGKKEKPK